MMILLPFIHVGRNNSYFHTGEVKFPASHLKTKLTGAKNLQNPAQRRLKFSADGVNFKFKPDNPINIWQRLTQPKIAARRKTEVEYYEIAKKDYLIKTQPDRFKTQATISNALSEETSQTLIDEAMFELDHTLNLRDY